MEQGINRTGKKLFEGALDRIQRSIAFISSRNRLGASEREDFSSYVTLKLIENDYARLRQFRGESSLETYMNVVVQRLFLDFRSHQWRKWRPSARARALGEPGVLLERLLYRDGLDWTTLGQTLEGHGVRLGSDELQELVREIRQRPKRQHVAPEAVDEIKVAYSSRRLSEGERALAAERLEAVLSAAARELSAIDRLILKLRFADGCTVKEIAQVLGEAQGPLYSRIKSTLRRLRKSLEGEGFDRSDAELALLERIDIDLELVLGNRNAACGG